MPESLPRKSVKRRVRRPSDERLHNLDSRLHRMYPEGGYYRTHDGHFEIARGTGIYASNAAWAITGLTEEGRLWLDAMEAQGIGPYRSKADAIGYLRGSVYAEPHGWAHLTREECIAAANSALYKPMGG